MCDLHTDPGRGRRYRVERSQDDLPTSTTRQTRGGGLPRAKVSCQAGPTAQSSSCSLVMTFHGMARIFNPLSSASAFLRVVTHPSTLRGNKSPGELGQNTRERKKKTRICIWQGHQKMSTLPFCYTAKLCCILSRNNQTRIQIHFPWMELGFWGLFFFSPYSDTLTSSSNWTGPHKIVIKIGCIIIILDNIY